MYPTGPRSDTGLLGVATSGHEYLMTFNAAIFEANYNTNTTITKNWLAIFILVASWAPHPYKYKSSVETARNAGNVTLFGTTVNCVIIIVTDSYSQYSHSI